MLKLCDKVIAFTLKHVRGASASTGDKYKKRSKDNLNSIEYRQLSYYIGGSVVKGFLWKGNQYAKDSNVWSCYCEVLRKRFLRSDETGENQCEDSVRAFTDAQDRGGLTHLSTEGFSFFATLFDLIMNLESDTGSMPPDVVEKHILVHDVILCLWDSAVGNDLKEDQSLDLLIQICNSCIKVVMKGIMKRLLNDHLKKALNSVALRARLAH